MEQTKAISLDLGIFRSGIYIFASNICFPFSCSGVCHTGATLTFLLLNDWQHNTPPVHGAYIACLLHQGKDDASREQGRVCEVGVVLGF